MTLKEFLSVYRRSDIVRICLLVQDYTGDWTPYKLDRATEKMFSNYEIVTIGFDEEVTARISKNGISIKTDLNMLLRNNK